eukprot:Clim_evm86s88 gene=Clim_evmTU86s88
MPEIWNGFYMTGKPSKKDLQTMLDNVRKSATLGTHSLEVFPEGIDVEEVALDSETVRNALQHITNLSNKFNKSHAVLFRGYPSRVRSRAFGDFMRNCVTSHYQSKNRGFGDKLNSAITFLEHLSGIDSDKILTTYASWRLYLEENEAGAGTEILHGAQFYFAVVSGSLFSYTSGIIPDILWAFLYGCQDRGIRSAFQLDLLCEPDPEKKQAGIEVWGSFLDLAQQLGIDEQIMVRTQRIFAVILHTLFLEFDADDHGNAVVMGHMDVLSRLMDVNPSDLNRALTRVEIDLGDVVENEPMKLDVAMQNQLQFVQILFHAMYFVLVEEVNQSLATDMSQSVDYHTVDIINCREAQLENEFGGWNDAAGEVLSVFLQNYVIENLDEMSAGIPDREVLRARDAARFWYNTPDSVLRITGECFERHMFSQKAFSQTFREANDDKEYDSMVFSMNGTHLDVSRDGHLRKYETKEFIKDNQMFDLEKAKGALLKVARHPELLWIPQTFTCEFGLISNLEPANDRGMSARAESSAGNLMRLMAAIKLHHRSFDPAIFYFFRRGTVPLDIQARHLGVDLAIYCEHNVKVEISTEYLSKMIGDQAAVKAVFKQIGIRYEPSGYGVLIPPIALRMIEARKPAPKMAPSVKPTAAEENGKYTEKEGSALPEAQATYGNLETGVANLSVKDAPGQDGNVYGNMDIINNGSPKAVTHAAPVQSGAGPVYGNIDDTRGGAPSEPASGQAPSPPSGPVYGNVDPAKAAVAAAAVAAGSCSRLTQNVQPVYGNMGQVQKPGPLQANQNGPMYGNLDSPAAGSAAGAGNHGRGSMHDTYMTPDEIDRNTPPEIGIQPVVQTPPEEHRKRPSENSTVSGGTHRPRMPTLRLTMRSNASGEASSHSSSPRIGRRHMSVSSAASGRPDFGSFDIRQIYPNMERGEAERVLAEYPNGICLIRSKPGQDRKYPLSYKLSEGVVRHFIVHRDPRSDTPWYMHETAQFRALGDLLTFYTETPLDDDNHVIHGYAWQTRPWRAPDHRHTVSNTNIATTARTPSLGSGAASVNSDIPPNERVRRLDADIASLRKSIDLQRVRENLHREKQAKLGFLQRKEKRQLQAIIDEACEMQLQYRNRIASMEKEKYRLTAGNRGQGSSMQDMTNFRPFQ